MKSIEKLIEFTDGIDSLLRENKKLNCINSSYKMQLVVLILGESENLSIYDFDKVDIAISFDNNPNVVNKDLMPLKINSWDDMPKIELGDHKKEDELNK